MSYTYNFYNRQPKPKVFSSNKAYKSTSITDFFKSGDKDETANNNNYLNNSNNNSNNSNISNSLSNSNNSNSINNSNSNNNSDNNSDNNSISKSIDKKEVYNISTTTKFINNKIVNNSYEETEVITTANQYFKKNSSSENTNRNVEYKQTNIKISPLGKKLKRLNYPHSYHDEDLDVSNKNDILGNNSLDSNSLDGNNGLANTSNMVESGIKVENIVISNKNNSCSNNINSTPKVLLKPTLPIRKPPTSISPSPSSSSLSSSSSPPSSNVDSGNSISFNNSNNKSGGFTSSLSLFQSLKHQQTLNDDSSTISSSFTTTGVINSSIDNSGGNNNNIINSINNNNDNNNKNNSINNVDSVNNNNVNINNKPIIQKSLAFSQSNLSMSTPNLSLSLNKFSSSLLNSSNGNGFLKPSILNNKPNSNNSNQNNLNLSQKIFYSLNSPSNNNDSNKNNMVSSFNASSFSLMNKNNNNSGNNKSLTSLEVVSKISTSSKGVPFSEIQISESLTEEQRYVLNLAVKGESLFFTGSAGTGKSYLLKEMVRVLRLMYPNSVYLTASTGIAACNIGGTTVHSFAGIGLGDKSVREHSRIILNNKQTLTRWRDVKVLVIDEVSMISSMFLDKLEEIAREVRRSKEPFGGIQLILCGDFCQLPPVVKSNVMSNNNNKNNNNSNNNINSSRFCFRSNCWDYVINRSIELRKVFRQKDQQFIDILNQIRMGIVDDSTLSLLNNHCWNRQLSSDDGIIPTVLYPHRSNVDQENQARLGELSTESKIYQAIDTNQPGYGDTLKNSPAQEVLTLKIGAQVILIKNLDIENELVNGSRGVVVGWTDFAEQEEALPIVRFSNGITRVISRELWRFEFGEVVIASRRQIPLNLAWALSIHKGQGMTIDKLVIDLKDTFESGQAYVALSRSTGLNGLQLKSKIKKENIMIDKDVITFYKYLS